MKGRPPKPREQRIREGLAGHRPLPEPLLIAGRPRAGEWDEAPAHLPADARDFWNTTVARLVEVGIVDRVDAPLLELMSVQFARACQARRVIAEVGIFARGSKGSIVEHPAVAIERAATAMFSRLGEQFALSATSRARLGLAELHARVLTTEMRDQLGVPSLRVVPIDGEPSSN